MDAIWLQKNLLDRLRKKSEATGKSEMLKRLVVVEKVVKKN